MSKNKYTYTTFIIRIVIILLFSSLNVGLSYFNNKILQSPIFLDSIFTIAIAMIYGPVSGIIVGLLTNISMEFVYGFTGYYWPFALCNMLTGLIVGIMSRKGRFDKIWYLLIAILILTISNALSGSLIANILYGGYTDVKIDQLMDILIDTGVSIYTAAFWSRIPANLIDKMISVYIAFLLYFAYLKKKGLPLPTLV